MRFQTFMAMKIQVEVTLRHSEDGSSMDLRNVGVLSPALQTRRSRLETSLHRSSLGPSFLFSFHFSFHSLSVIYLLVE